MKQVHARMLRQLLLIASLIVLVVPEAFAETELENFEKAVPPRGRLSFSMYKACTLIKGKGATFAQIEASIEKECKADLEKAERELASVGFDETKRRETINKFRLLAANERRLHFEKKPIPGYVVDPFTAQVMECGEKITSLKELYATCVDDALRNIVPTSNDPSNVVADAAMGICEPNRSELVTTTTPLCFFGDQSKAEHAVSLLTTKLRSSALGKVAALRAEMSRRRSIPQPSTVMPKPERGI